MKYKNRKEILVDESLVLAPLGKRFLAILLDIVFIVLIIVIFQIIIQLVGFDIKNVRIEGFTHMDIESENMDSTWKFIMKAIFVCIPTIYFTFFTYYTQGQTIGKMILKIRVLSLYHKEIGFWHCLERSLGYVASSLELGLGFIQAFWNTNRMALHDKIAETIVVDKNK